MPSKVSSNMLRKIVLSIYTLIYNFHLNSTTKRKLYSFQIVENFLAKKIASEIANEQEIMMKKRLKYMFFLNESGPLKTERKIKRFFVFWYGTPILNLIALDKIYSTYTQIYPQYLAAREFY